MNKYTDAFGNQGSHFVNRKLQIWNEGRNKRSDVGWKLEVSVGINYLKLCVCVCNKLPVSLHCHKLEAMKPQ